MLGLISTYWHQPHEPVERDLRLLDVLARQAADSIERGRVEEELRRSGEDLELRVNERTAELFMVNEVLKAENTERLRVEEERINILHRLVSSQEDERRRIGRDLHDQLGQQVTALRLKLEAIGDMSANYPEIHSAVIKAQDHAKLVDTDVEFLTFELRPTALDDLGLVAAIEIFVNEWSGNHKIAAEFRTTGTLTETLPSETEINLYRIVQEALNNILKHANAKHVTMHLDFRNSNLVLIIEDDGIGFDQQNLSIDIGFGSGLGLIGMRERCLLIGGNLEIESAPGKGTVIFARIPRSY